MKVLNIDKQEKNLVILTIAVEKEAWAEALSAAYKKNVSRMNVPGFRRGKAPRKMIETMYGEGVFYQDAVNATYSDAFEAAVEAEGLEPVEQPDVEVKDIDKDGYSFTAKFYVMPQVEIGAYKGLTAHKPPVVVEEDEIDDELEQKRLRNASLVTVERPAQMGDTIIFDYEGFLDDEPFQGGKGERYSLELGSGRFIPGFEEGLVGAEAGQPVDVELSFPEEYHAEHLAGEPVVFKCLLHEVKEKQLPDLDDEFAKDVSEFDTLEEYKNHIRTHITENLEQESQAAFENALVDQVIESMEADIPECMIEEQLSNIFSDLNYRLSMQGMDLKSYMQMTEMTAADLKAQYRPAAERHVKTGLIFDKIADLEAIEVTEEDVETEYNRLAEVYTMDVEKVKEAVSEKSVKHDLRALKASELIKNTGIATDVPPPDDTDDTDDTDDIQDEQATQE